MGTEGKGSPVHASTCSPSPFTPPLHLYPSPSCPFPSLPPGSKPSCPAPTPKGIPWDDASSSKLLLGGEPIAQARKPSFWSLCSRVRRAHPALGPVLSVSVRSFLGSSRNPVLPHPSAMPAPVSGHMGPHESYLSSLLPVTPPNLVPAATFP